MIGPDLAFLFEEMQGLASIIDSPTNWLPRFGDAASPGLNVGISKDGRAYLLTSTDDGVVELVVSDEDKCIVLEHIFSSVTRNMAIQRVVNCHVSGGVGKIFPGRYAGIKQMREVHLLQEEILGRLDEAWRSRQAVKNALELGKNVDAHFGIK